MTSDDELREEAEEAAESVRITDRRRIDPETGEVRAPAGGPASDSADVVEAEIVDAADDAAEAQSAEVAELTETLQRLAAEYKNYRDRTQREISESRLKGRADVVTALIDTLDDIDRAAEHGELDGPTKAIADNLNAALTRLGVLRYGEVGDVFDPAIHEAMTHAEGDGNDGPAVCSAIYQPGYRMGERVVRPARVGVTE